MTGLRFPKRKTSEVAPPLASLIDIVFLLLVFFLLTTSFITEEGIDVKLPEADGSEHQVQEQITIDVDSSGRLYLTGREVTQEALSRELLDLASNNEKCTVVIRADRSVILDKAVRVMDLAKAAGVDRLCLATKKPNESADKFGKWEAP